MQNNEKVVYSKNGGERDKLFDREQLQKLCKTVTKQAKTGITAVE